MQSIYSSYTQIIKYLINLLVNFNKTNFIRVEQYHAYKDTNDFHKLMKISNEYYDRYSTELKAYWTRE